MTRTIEIPDSLTDEQAADVVEFAKSIAELTSRFGSCDSWACFAVHEGREGIDVISGGWMPDVVFDGMADMLSQGFSFIHAVETGQVEVLHVDANGEPVPPEAMN